jgi:NDP-sugar pyrophosphorylase family protein
LTKALILAGGEGVRLRPLTYSVPKPLLPIKGKPILEIIIENLSSFGINEIILATGYRSYMIEAYFLNGSRHNVKIDYLVEETQMGTAAPLKLLESDVGEQLLVMNGDVLTDLNYKELLSFHSCSGSNLTICVTSFKYKVPYGIVKYDSSHLLIGIAEKPIEKHMVNAGIYVVNSELISLIPKGKKYNMTDLIVDTKKNKKRVCVFEIKGKWVDIGLMDDYQRANKSGH